MSQLPLDRRLELADELVATHPGRPISAALLELFPELRQIPKRDIPQALEGQRHIQLATPPWWEHVPERWAEQLTEPSRHLAVGLPARGAVEA